MDPKKALLVLLIPQFWNSHFFKINSLVNFLILRTHKPTCLLNKTVRLVGLEGTFHGHLVLEGFVVYPLSHASTWCIWAELSNSQCKSKAFFLIQVLIYFVFNLFIHLHEITACYLFVLSKRLNFLFIEVFWLPNKEHIFCFLYFSNPLRD